MEPLTVPGEPDYLGSLSTLASSTQQINIKVCTKCHYFIHKVYSYISLTLPVQQEEEGHGRSKSRNVPESDDDSTLSSGSTPAVIPLSLRQVPSVEPSIEGDDSQLDDLMFMLKTQNLPQDEDMEPLFPEGPHKPTASEHLELRRISIADTHL